MSSRTTRYPMSFAAVQKHVVVLERAGLVSKKRRGRDQLVRADADGLGRARKALEELEATWRGRVGRMSGPDVGRARRRSAMSHFGRSRAWGITAVDPPTRLEFTDAFADADGTPIAESRTRARERLDVERECAEVPPRGLAGNGRSSVQSGSFDERPGDRHFCRYYGRSSPLGTVARKTRSPCEVIRTTDPHARSCLPRA